MLYEMGRIDEGNVRAREVYLDAVRLDGDEAGPMLVSSGRRGGSN